MDVATKTTTLLTCVSDTPDLLEVVEGPEGILQTLNTGSLLIDAAQYSHRPRFTSGNFSRPRIPKHSMRR